jgi:hypothetical protein
MNAAICMSVLVFGGWSLADSSTPGGTSISRPDWARPAGGTEKPFSDKTGTILSTTFSGYYTNAPRYQPSALPEIRTVRGTDRTISDTRRYVDSWFLDHSPYVPPAPVGNADGNRFPNAPPPPPLTSPQFNPSAPAPFNPRGVAPQQYFNNLHQYYPQVGP